MATSSRSEHGDDPSQAYDSKKINCIFFERGTCKFGDTCRYSHEELAPPEGTALAKTSLKVSVKSHEDNWADAVEFVPGSSYKPRNIDSYSNTVGTKNAETKVESEPDPTNELCPYNMLGDCRYKENCLLVHGLLCEMCGLKILHPENKEQQRKHKEECVSIHEEDMNESFKLAKNQDISCGICMEKVVEKALEKDRKFGILENCNHAFCLSCIRKWRQAKSFKSSVVKACPECRVASTFVTPSDYFIENKEEKEALIKGYKDHLSEKPCMYFKKGKGRCPFGVKCFYLHVYEDGTKQDRTKPQKSAKNADGEWRDIDPASLWEFFGEHDDSSPYGIDIEETLEWLDLLHTFGSDVSGDYMSDHFNWFNSDFDTDSDSDFSIF